MIAPNARTVARLLSPTVTLLLLLHFPAGAEPAVLAASDMTDDPELWPMLSSLGRIPGPARAVSLAAALSQAAREPGAAPPSGARLWATGELPPDGAWGALVEAVHPAWASRLDPAPFAVGAGSLGDSLRRLGEFAAEAARRGGGAALCAGGSAAVLADPAGLLGDRMLAVATVAGPAGASRDATWGLLAPLARAYLIAATRPEVVPTPWPGVEAPPVEGEGGGPGPDGPA